jgi:uncharacterized PurR-regulated membrane protein YhhQ (DUF165 family)
MVYLYFLSIVLANVITAAFAPISIGMLLIPCGSFLIGATFIFRDLVQNQHGRKKTYLFIIGALILSGITSRILGDPLAIMFASAVAFAVSETTDTEIYSRLRLPMSQRVLYSGIAGGILDSSIFVVIGLSPIGAGFLSWELVPYAIAGQIIVKVIMQGIGASLLSFIKTKEQSSTV